MCLIAFFLSSLVDMQTVFTVTAMKNTNILIFFHRKYLICPFQTMTTVSVINKYASYKPKEKKDIEEHNMFRNRIFLRIRNIF